MTQSFRQSPEELETFLDFLEEDIENIRRAVSVVREKDVDAEFIVHSKSETVEESVEKKGADRSQIVKTLVFVAGEEPVAVLCPGDRRVSESKLEDLTGKEVRMANPSEVKEATGYTVGGVSPFDLELPVHVEQSIMELEVVNAAAGSRVAGVEMTPEDLLEVSEGDLADLAE